jgi:hypothetical protein
MTLRDKRQKAPLTVSRTRHKVRAKAPAHKAKMVRVSSNFDAVARAVAAMIDVSPSRVRRPCGPLSKPMSSATGHEVLWSAAQGLLSLCERRTKHSALNSYADQHRWSGAKFRHHLWHVENRITYIATRCATPGHSLGSSH